MPALKKIVSTINNILSPIISWIEKNKELAQMITTAIARLIGFRIATFALGYASTFLFGSLNKLVIVFKGLKLATTIAGIAFKIFFFGSAGRFTEILGLIIFGAGRLSKVFRGGVFQSVKMVSEKISNFCTLLKNKMVPAFAGVGAVKIYENWDAIKEFFLNLWKDIKARWPETTSFLENTFCLIKTTFQFTYQMGVMVYRVLENVVAAISKFVLGADTIISAWEAVKNFFADFWSGPIKKFEDWVNKILGAGVVEKIKEQWNGLKNFFLDLWRQVTPNFSEWFSPLGDVWNRVKGFVPGFETSKAKNSSKLKLSNLEAPHINSGRNQNNNFAITINGTKNDDAESLANKVMNRVSDYSKTFLFDEVSI